VRIWNAHEATLHCILHCPFRAATALVKTLNLPYCFTSNMFRFFGYLIIASDVCDVDVDPLRYRPAVKGLCTRGER
jgi:hypothetical protein